VTISRSENGTLMVCQEIRLALIML
jgi:hypothetical protein